MYIAPTGGNVLPQWLVCIVCVIPLFEVLYVSVHRDNQWYSNRVRYVHAHTCG